MFCPQCGTKNKPGSKFCGNCGFDFTAIEKEVKVKAKPVKKKSGAGWIIALILVVVIAAFAFLFIHANFELNIPFADTLHLDFLEVDLGGIDLPDWLPFADRIEELFGGGGGSIRDKQSSRSDDEKQKDVSSEADEPIEEAPVEEAPVEEPAVEPAAELPPARGDGKIIFVVPGYLEDNLSYDAAHKGLQEAAADFGFEYEAIEAGLDFYEIQDTILATATDSDADYIVSTWYMLDLLPELAFSNPGKNFILIDTVVDFSTTCAGCENVYALEFKRREATFLAGYYAGLMSQTGMIGAIGGMDLPVINDYLEGYRQGAMYAGLQADDVQIMYADSFADPAMGAALAENMFAMGADILFHVAAATAEGMFEAAADQGKWAIGVDTDQARAYMESDPDLASVILTSAEMNLDKGLYRTFELIAGGRLEWGANESIGVAEDAVGLAMNDIFKANTPRDIEEKVLEAALKISSGEIVVDSVY